MKALRQECEGKPNKMIEVNLTMGDRGQLPKGEEQPAFPITDSYLFATFQDLNAARTSNGFGPNPLTYYEMHSYAQLMGVELSAWDVRMLRRMDYVFLSAYQMAQPKPAAAKKVGGVK